MSLDSADWVEIGARIRELRRERGLTQRDVSDPVASPSFLSLIESGSRQPSQKVFAHIADRLGVDPQSLLTGASGNLGVELELKIQDARQLLNEGDLEGASRLARETALTAREHDLNKVEARCLELLGGVEERHSDIPSALGFYERAEALWSGESPHLGFQTIAGLARCRLMLGDARQAVHMLETYLLELERSGVPDPIAVMRTHSTLVICYSTLGLAERAAKAADQAQSLGTVVGDPEQVACMSVNVAHSLFDQGRYSDALAALHQAETAFASLGWRMDVARAKMNRAVVQIEKGDLGEARSNLVEAVVTFKEGGVLSEAAKALDELARVERLSGNVGEAKDLLLEARGYLAEGNFVERALNLREFGLCLQDGSADEAKGYFRRAIDLYLLGGLSKEVATTYRLLGELYLASGETELGIDALRAGLEAIEASPPLEG